MRENAGILQDLAAIILHRREERHIDYKSSMLWKDRDAKIMTIRCILGMANLHNGGYIVFGVSQQGNEFFFDGMAQDHIKSFTQDNIDTDIKNYADPSVDVTVTIVPRKFVRDIAKEIGIQNFAENGGDFAVIQVNGFDDIPVICKKDGKLKNSDAEKDGVKKGNICLRNGAVYIRPKGKVETSEAKVNEMREILELAADKSLRKLIDRMGRSGITGLIGSIPSDRERFDDQLEEVK